MKRCKHKRWAWYVAGTDHAARIRRCLCCSRLLPIGHAADDKPEVQIEIKAADIHARVIDAEKMRRGVFLSSLGCDGAEIAGWLEAQYDSDKLPEQPGEHAGYLARLIYEHKEEA